MTFAQRRNRLTTHFSERIPVVKWHMTVFMFSYTCKGLATGRSPIQGSSNQCPKQVDPETRKTEGPGPHWPVAPYGGRCTQGPVRLTCCPLDTTHAHRRLSYCSFQGGTLTLFCTVWSLWGRGIWTGSSNVSRLHQKLIVVRLNNILSHFLMNVKAHMCSERPTTGPNSVTPKLISAVLKVSFPPHRKHTARIHYKNHALNNSLGKQKHTLQGQKVQLQHCKPTPQWPRGLTL